MKIDDGKGSGRSVGVNTEQRLETASVTLTRENLSSVLGNAYTWVSNYSANTGEVVLYIKNTEILKKLVITSITLGGVNAALWNIFKVTSGTPAGTTMTGVNQNFNSPNVANVTALGDAAVTGSVVGSTLHAPRSVALSCFEVKTDGGIIIGQNNAIGVIYTGSTGLVEVVAKGYFDD